jgi:hypothetical protein
MGGKVFPMYFITTEPEAPVEVYDKLVVSVNLRYALSILVIIFPAIFLIALILLGWRYRLIQAYKEADGTSSSAVRTAANKQSSDDMKFSG